MGSNDRLIAARKALARGHVRRAVRHARNAGLDAARKDDEHALRLTRDFATELAERSRGREREDAEKLANYCSHVLADIEAGVERTSPLFSVFKRTEQPALKRCPDCAEQVQRAAKVCRFCGYHFEQS